VIATRVRVACERFTSTASSQPTCSAVPIEFDHVPTDDELSLRLKGFGYVTDADGKHLCLRHADGGERFTVTGEYQEIAPGVLVRMPQSWVVADVEVKRVKTDG
jgi:hypothetical protein